MKLDKRLILIILVMLTTAGCDQGTKSLAGSYLPRNEMASYFYDSIRIGYVENTGAFLGLGDALPENLRFWLFTVIVAGILTCLFLYVILTPVLKVRSVIGISLILGGGFSNLYDRVVNTGAVVDFLNVGIGAVRTGIFNVADMGIMLGVTLVLLAQSKKMTEYK